MDRSSRTIERQRVLVETLRRQLHFELLLLQRLTREKDGAEPPPSSLRDVLERAANRQVEGLLSEAEAAAPRG